MFSWLQWYNDFSGVIYNQKRKEFFGALWMRQEKAQD
jgi:hypothetical protein